jgi:hypothetical protein
MARNQLSIIERLKAPTSAFFKKVRNIGIGLTAVGGTILAAPVGLPAIVITVAGYLTVVGGVMTAVAQATVENE